MRHEEQKLGSVHIRDADLSDLADVVAIEQAASQFPWPRRIFRDELRQGWSRLLLLIPPGADRPVSFLNYSLDRDEVPILNIATHPFHRRRGYARRLLHTMIEEVRSQGGRLVTLEVRRSNTGAITLYQGLGFRSIGVRPGYYAAYKEDALVFVRRLTDPKGEAS